MFRKLPLVFLSIAALALSVNHLSAAADQSTDIVAHARAALGGDQALGAVQRLRIVGAIRRQAGERELDGTLEVDLQRPDKFLQVETMNPMGDLTLTRKTGFNGDQLLIGSEQHGGAPGMVIRMGQPPADEAGKAQMVRGLQGDFARDLVAWLLDTPAGGSFTYVGRAEAPDGQADVLDVAGPNGFKLRLFLDTKSGRPLMASWRGAGRRIRVMTQRRGPGGPPAEAGAEPPPHGEAPEADIQLFFSDYHKVDGIQFPFHISRSENGDTVEEWTIKKVDVNPTFDPDQFSVKQ